MFGPDPKNGPYSDPDPDIIGNGQVRWCGPDRGRVMDQAEIGSAHVLVDRSFLVSFRIYSVKTLISLEKLFKYSCNFRTSECVDMLPSILKPIPMLFKQNCAVFNLFN